MSAIETTDTTTDMAAFEGEFRSRFHIWPRDPRYRPSGAIRPRAGDIALCGIVKKHASATVYPPRSVIDLVDCPQCLRLEGLA